MPKKTINETIHAKEANATNGGTVECIILINNEKEYLIKKAKKK
jgi:hypothetical protein